MIIGFIKLIMETMILKMRMGKIMVMRMKLMVRNMVLNHVVLNIDLSSDMILKWYFHIYCLILEIVVSFFSPDECEG